MSPILVRPVREQLEHDRVIRLLQARYKKKSDVAINPGNVQTTPVVIGSSPWYPDLVLQSVDRARRVLGTIEVETAESVNHLEAMSQWAAFSRLRSPFHLYVPASSIDTARRLCTDLQITVAELWAFSAIGDQMRFTLVHRAERSADGKGAGASKRAPTASRRPAPAAKARAGRASAPKPARRASTQASRAKAAAKKGAGSGAARQKSAGSARLRKRK